MNEPRICEIIEEMIKTDSSHHYEMLFHHSFSGIIVLNIISYLIIDIFY